MYQGRHAHRPGRHRAARPTRTPRVLARGPLRRWVAITPAVTVAALGAAGALTAFSVEQGGAPAISAPIETAPLTDPLASPSTTARRVSASTPAATPTAAPATNPDSSGTPTAGSSTSGAGSEAPAPEATPTPTETASPAPTARPTASPSPEQDGDDETEGPLGPVVDPVVEELEDTLAPVVGKLP